MSGSRSRPKASSRPSPTSPSCRDQDLELEAFNRAFEVRADDRRFASDLLDARMVAFLVEQAAGCVIETVGNRILVARPAAGPPDLDALLLLAFGVADRVPNAVKALYPPLPAGELTPRCPIGPVGRRAVDRAARRAIPCVRSVARRARRMGLRGPSG